MEKDRDIDGDASGADRLEPRQRRSREARERILSAAETVLREGGVDAFSMAAVAKAANFPVGNIYRRFEGKDDLLQALKELVAIRIRSGILEAVHRGGHDSLESYVCCFATSVGKTFARDEVLNRALYDPKLTNARLVAVGQTTRSSIFEVFQTGLSEYLPMLDNAHLTKAARVSFSIIANAAALKIRDADPVLTGVSWPELSKEFGNAAIAYLNSRLSGAE